MTGFVYVFAALAGAVVAAGLTWLLINRITGAASRETSNKLTGLEDQQTRDQQQISALGMEKVLLTERLQARERKIEELNEQIAAVENTLEAERRNLGQAKLDNVSLKTTLEEQRQQHEEKLKLLKEAKDVMQADFKNLANEIFSDKQKEFKEQSKEQLSGVLDPLKEKIHLFEKQVKEAQSEELRGRTSLLSELRHLKELNSKISEDAVNLTNALKGETHTQGVWGEMVLERLLEESGLKKGREYDVQVSLKHEDGRRMQPDVIVRLPDNKDVIIDSKVSLTAYERFRSAESEAERETALKQHVLSMTNHFKGLAERDYQSLEGLRTLDFVLMFVPIEAAFAVATTADQNLFSDALSRNIAIVTPTTLLVTLRTVQTIWRYEQQHQNAQEIASRAGALYDKFVGFVQDLEDVGKRLDSTKTAWEGARNKLATGKGNLVRRAEEMKSLGISANKSLPERMVENAGMGIEHKDENEAEGGNEQEQGQEHNQGQSQKQDQP